MVKALKIVITPLVLILAALMVLVACMVVFIIPMGAQARNKMPGRIGWTKEGAHRDHR